MCKKCGKMIVRLPTMLLIGRGEIGVRFELDGAREDLSRRELEEILDHIVENWPGKITKIKPKCRNQ